MSALLQTAIIGVMGWFLHPVVVALVLLSSAPRALMTAPLNAAVAPRVRGIHRATYLSIQSLAGRLSFLGVLVGLSFVAGQGEPAAWPVLSSMLHVSLAIALIGFAVLAVTVPRSLAGDSKR